MICLPALEAICTCLVAALALLAVSPAARRKALRHPATAISLFALACMADSFAFAKDVPPPPGPPPPPDQTNLVKRLVWLLHADPACIRFPGWATPALHPEVAVDDARGYETEGLVCWYDGIDNAGTGVHATGAKTWTNLADPATNKLTLARGSNGWTRRSLKTRKITGGDASTLPAALFPAAMSGIKTVEIVYRVDSAQNANGEAILFVSGNDEIVASSVGGGTAERSIILSKTNRNRIYAVPNGYTTNLVADAGEVGRIHRLSYVWGGESVDAADWPVVLNGRQLFADRANNGSVGAQVSPASLGGRTTAANSPDNFNGEIYSVRLYDRALSVSEMLHNQLVDKERFEL